MKINAYTPEMLLAITPENIHTYLTSRGWEKVRSESAFDVFNNTLIEEPILVPNDVALGDYVRRVDDIISDLSRLYSESPQTIFIGLTMSSAPSILEYRYEPKSGEIGLISGKDLVDLIQTGNALNNYAYRDMVRFETHYKSSNWEGKSVLDCVKIGPTSPGSYIVQFIYPSTTDTRMMHDDTTSECNICSICDKVETSLRAVADAANRGKTSLDPELRISHNFVETVMDLEMRSADVSVIRTSSTEEHERIAFSERTFRNISRIEAGMRPPTCEKETTVVGYVVQVNDSRQSRDGPVTVRVRFMDPDEEKVRTAVLTVDGPDADTAYEASRLRRMVSISGTLVGGSGARRIEGITDLRLIARRRRGQFK